MNDETHAQNSPQDTAVQPAQDQPETGAEVAGPLRVLAAAAEGRADTSFLRMPQPARQFGTDDSLAPAAARLAPVCVIPPGMKFKGTADFPCSVRIQGEFEGKVTAAEGFTITVESAGVLSGESHATNIRIEGKADGVIEASGGLASFGPKATCTGEVRYTRLAIEEGADVEASMKKAKAAA